MNIEFYTNNHLKIDHITMQKMAFMYNAIEDGWSIKKNNDNYIFTKNHEGKREILLDSYLQKFMTSNMDINKICDNNNNIK